VNLITTRIEKWYIRQETIIANAKTNSFGFLHHKERCNREQYKMAKKYVNAIVIDVRKGCHAGFSAVVVKRHSGFLAMAQIFTNIIKALVR